MIFTSVLIGCWDYSNLCFDFTQLKHSLCVTERRGGGVGGGQIWDKLSMVVCLLLLWVVFDDNSK